MSLGSHETRKARAANIKVEVTFAAAHTSSEGGLTRLSNFSSRLAGNDSDLEEPRIAGEKRNDEVQS